MTLDQGASRRMIQIINIQVAAPSFSISYWMSDS